MSAAIVCADYRIDCKTIEEAERKLAGIVKFGECKNEHRIETTTAARSAK